MPLGLPPSPALNQTWPPGSPKIRYDGSKWVAIPLVPLTATLPSLSNNDQSLWFRDGVPYLVTALAAASYFGGTPAASIPATIAAGDWSAEATLVAGQIGINISVLPLDGGSAITALQYRVNGGTAVSLVGVGTGLRVVTVGFSAGVSADIEVRAVNAVSADPANWSPVKTRTPLAGASSPSAMTAGQWTATATAVPGEISFDFTALPSNGGSPITALEYRVGTGAAISFVGTGTGVRVVTAGLTPGVAADLQVRAINAVDANPSNWSDVKNRTPLAGVGGYFSAAYTAHAVDGNEFQNPKVFTGLGIGAADATRKVYIYLFARGPTITDVLTLSVNGGAALTPIASEKENGNRLVVVFVADVPTGTTMDLSFSSAGNDFNNCGVAAIRAVGAHTALSAGFTIFGTTNGSINTNAGDTIFSGVMYGGDFGAGFFGVPSGFTEHFDQPTRPSLPAQPATLRSGIAVGGTPESFPGTVSDSGGTSEVVLRLRAA